MLPYFPLHCSPPPRPRPPPFRCGCHSSSTDFFTSPGSFKNYNRLERMMSAVTAAVTSTARAQVPVSEFNPNPWNLHPAAMDPRTSASLSNPNHLFTFTRLLVSTTCLFPASDVWSAYSPRWKSLKVPSAGFVPLETNPFRRNTVGVASRMPWGMASW